MLTGSPAQARVLLPAQKGEIMEELPVRFGDVNGLNRRDVGWGERDGAGCSERDGAGWVWQCLYLL
jgi:hypothetical protein